jgi:hypothetical protein
MTYEIEMAGTTMEEKNAALRAAVEARTAVAKASGCRAAATTSTRC